MAINQRRKISRVAYLVFTKKYGLHLHSDATRYLEELLQDEENLTETLEKIVKAYKRRFADQSTVIVSKQNVQEVVTSLQTSAAAAAIITPFTRPEDELEQNMQDMTIREKVDVAQHFHVVGAFDMPRYHYHAHRKAFVRSSEHPSLLGSAKAKGDLFRDRFQIIKQRLLRNENFAPSSMYGAGTESFLKITPIKALIGHDREHFLLFGMLTQLEEGKLFLEDEDGYVQLDLSEATYGSGLFTDGTFVLAEGVYGDDHIFHVDEIGFPPAEHRERSDALFKHVDFLGLPKPLIDEDILRIEETANNDIFFVILSDVWLDQPRVMDALRRIFEGYSNDKIPLAFIFIGNFTSRPFVNTGAHIAQYRDNFSTLADLVSEFPAIATYSYFVFVPGNRDPWGGNNLPQPAIPEFLTSRVKQKVRRAIFTTNPCRIRYCTQDIVIYREDILARLWRNTLLPPHLGPDEHPTRHLVRTVVDQGHLCPLPLSVRPIYWTYDHALRLYPLPHAVVLADQCDNFGITYEGSHCICPGSFPNSDYSWSTYYPAKKVSERCILPT